MSKLPEKLTQSGPVICDENGHVATCRTEAHAHELTARYNGWSAMREVLAEALPYVLGAYECAFPNESENERIVAAITAILSPNPQEKQA
jgi:hypothetical protein